MPSRSWMKSKRKEYTSKDSLMGNDDEWEFEDVSLTRTSHGLGFSIAGGYDNPHIDDDPSIYITKLIAGGTASRDGRLHVNDIIARVNGVSVTNVTHEYAVEALKKAGVNVHLSVKRRREPRRERRVKVELIKGGKGLGFSIAGGIGNQHIPGDNGIYVTKVMDGGAAQLDGRMSVGDKLVAVDAGRGDKLLYNVTHEEAVSVLKSVKDRVCLTLLQPDLSHQHQASEQTGNITTNGTHHHHHHHHSLHEQAARSISDVPDSSALTASPPAHSSVMSMERGLSRVGDDNSASTLPRTSTSFTTAHNNNNNNNSNNSNNVLSDSTSGTRTVTLQRGGHGLGFNIVGGDESQGIFISFILAGGEADRSGRLMRGDQILGVNDQDISQASHEQAAHVLKGAGDTVNLLVQHRPDEYNRFEARIHELKQQIMSGTLRTTQKRSLYVRALFDYDPRTDDGLPSRGLVFSFGDILHVTNASDDQWWQARRLAPATGQQLAVGIVPADARWQRKQRARGKTVVFDGARGRHSASGNDMSTLERRKKNFSFSRKFPFMKSKEDIKNEDGSDENEFVVSGANASESDERSMTVTDDSQQHHNNQQQQQVLTYEPVQHVEVSYCRPVIVLGPLKDRINDDLISQYPDDFGSCVPHTTRSRRDGEEDRRDYHFVSSRAQMELDIQNHLFIEAGQYNDNLYGTSVASVRDVAEQQKKHCILDVSGNAIRRLHVAQLYPIAVLVKPRSEQQILEWNKRLTDDQAKKVFEKCQKIEQEFAEYLTAIVTGDTPEDVYERVKDIIREQGTNRIWIPSKEKL